MRTTASLALLLAAGQAGAASVLHFVLTSANGGSSTLVTYSLAGDWVTGAGLEFTSGEATVTLSAFGAQGGTGFSLADPAIPLFKGPLAGGLESEEFTPLDLPTISLTNLNTDVVSYVGGFGLTSFTFEGVAYNQLQLLIEPGLPVNNGEFLLFGGATTGSFTIDKSYDFFNQGVWISGGGSITVGTPVPEPSTYGLVLGGLALAGAAIRRRRKQVA